MTESQPTDTAASFELCETGGCPNRGVVRGTYAADGVYARVSYCPECAADLAGQFTPDAGTPPEDKAVGR